VKEKRCAEGTLLIPRNGTVRRGATGHNEEPAAQQFAPAFC
jgi:hypothetical protein